MKLDEFVKSVDRDEPPAELSVALESLWYASRGDWDRAHALAQSLNNEEGAWVHAYLHRVEGDLGNASYWYRRASRPVCVDPLELEWHSIAKALLE